MWISIIGAEGTCKRKIAEWFRDQQGFRIADDTYKPDDLLDDCFYHQADFLTSRYDMQYDEIQSSMNDEDIIQLRSFWDTQEVYTKVLIQHEKITKADAEVLANFYDSLNRSLTPPTTVFYCKASKIDSLDLMKLKQKTPHHEEYLLSVRNAYEDYVSRIRIPVVEIDVAQPFDKLTEVLSFGLNSVKSTALAGQSVWKKTMMRGGIR